MGCGNTLGFRWPERAARARGRGARPVGRVGFTLIEMIGVLAVVAILASLIVPRVFQAITDAKVNQTASRCTSTKAAVNQYYGRYGQVGGTNGTSLGLVANGSIYEDWDLRCLVTEGFLDQPFAVGIGNRLLGSANGGSRIHVINIRGNDLSTRAIGSGSGLDSGAYDLDGTGATNDVMGAFVVEACIEGVDNRDAVDLSSRIDGDSLTPALGLDDEAGHVKFLVSSNGTARVRVYLAHR